MRKLLLSLALAFTATAMQAQSWTAPELNITTSAVPDSGYLYHIGQQMFFTKGTTWGTHAALTDDAGSALLYQFQTTSSGDYQLYSAGAANTGYLGRSTYADLYTDYNSQSAWDATVVFTKVGNYWRVQTAPDATTYGSAADETNGTDYNTYLMGWNPSNDDLNSSGTSLGTNVGIFMLDTTLDGVELDWGFVLVDDYEIYSARKDLYDLLNEAAEIGASYASASGVYTNSSATVDEINEAITQLKQAIADYQQGTASEDNPIDMTSLYLVNADFTDGTLSPWATDNGVLVYNTDALPNSSCTATEWNNGESSSNNAAAWTSSSNTLGDERLYQTISNLPAGKYVLTGSFVAQHGTDMPTGVYLFANGVVENRMQIQHDETLWNAAVEAGTNNQRILRPELEIVHAGGDLTVGLQIESTNCNWVYAMWFKLICYGETDMNAYATALSQVLSQAQVYEDDATYVYSEETFYELESQIENASALIGNGAEDSEYEEATTNLSALITTIKEEIDAYSTLATLIETVTSDIERYGEVSALTELVYTLETLSDDYNAGYEDRTATIDQINAWADAYDETILTYVKDAMANATPDDPVEITALATNMSYDENSWDGWTLETGSVGGNSGAISYQVAEVWYNTFSCMQTLENMPAGSYKLTAKAFYRTGSNLEGYTAYDASNPTDGIITYLSVAGGSAPVVNQAAGAITASEAPYTGYTDFTEDGSGIWLPNTRQAASWAFEQDDTYLCSASGYLTADGDLTFGIYNNELTASNAWSLWDDFRLYYCGTDNSALYEQMLTVQNEAISLQDYAYMISEADQLLNDAIGAADDMTADNSEEELTAVINQLNEAIDYVNTGVDLISELTEAYDDYALKMNDVESDDETFPELLGTIGDAISAEEFESNDQIQTWLDTLPSAWTAYVQYDTSSASLTNPIDYTSLLTNPKFDTGTNDNNEATGWTREYTVISGGHVGIASTTQQESSDYAYEYWNVSAMNLYQELTGLAEGYYRITCNAASRQKGNSETSYGEYLANPDSVSNVKLYANTRHTVVTHLFSEAQTESTYGDGEGSLTYDGVTYYYPNSMASAYTAFSQGKYLNTVDIYVGEEGTLRIGLYMTDGESNNWCCFDNFTLSYLGNTEAPVGIESIESAATTADNSAIYDLSGRRVQKAKKGIYIINGKKMMVK